MFRRSTGLARCWQRVLSNLEATELSGGRLDSQSGSGGFSSLLARMHQLFLPEDVETAWPPSGQLGLGAVGMCLKQVGEP